MFWAISVEENNTPQLKKVKRDQLFAIQITAKPGY